MLKLIITVVDWAIITIVPNIGSANALQYKTFKMGHYGACLVELDLAASNKQFGQRSLRWHTLLVYTS